MKIVMKLKDINIYHGAKFESKFFNIFSVLSDFVLKYLNFKMLRFFFGKCFERLYIL